MELLIPGLILVALMVYASTRIKRSAAKAYEQEAIETDGFRLVKPEGYLNPLRDRSDYLFEAYSKEFGREEADKLNESAIYITSYSGNGFEAACDAVAAGMGSVRERSAFEQEGSRRCRIIGDAREKEIPVVVDTLIAESAEKIFEVRTVTLPEKYPDYSARLETMFASFALK